jgi:hypothetical protein
MAWGRAALMAAVVAGVVSVAAACSSPTPAPSPPPPPAATSAPAAPAPAAPPRGQPRLAADPVQLAADLIADEQTLRDASSTESARLAAARRQQVAYRAIGRHLDWDPIVRPRIPPPLLADYDRNVDARRQLTALSHGGARPTLPAWRIGPPPPVAELLDDYRHAEAATGVGWNYLAAINFVETAFGRIQGTSTAGAQGPMQFLPSTFAAYGAGGDIRSPRDSILAAGRYLAANGFARNRDAALYRYNNSTRYVRAVDDYAVVMASNPLALSAFHQWDVYYNSTAGDVVLPVGYTATAPVPVEQYLATNPQ